MYIFIKYNLRVLLETDYLVSVSSKLVHYFKPSATLNNHQTFKKNILYISDCHRFTTWVGILIVNMAQ